MKVTLLHYDVNRIVNEPGNKVVMKHFGHMPNIQLLYVAAVLEQLDVEIQYIDIVGMQVDDAELHKRLRSFQPDIVALSVYTSHFHNAAQYAKEIKRLLPSTRILVGGVHALIFPEETLRYIPDVDYVCVGEAEVVLPEFVRRFKSNAGFAGMQGIVWRDGDGAIHYAGPPQPLRDLDSAPFPARHLIPNEAYFNFISSRRNYTVFNTSRGCPFRCLFCEAGGQKWRARSAENVVEEFEVCYDRFGIREIDIFDSSFTINKQRVLDICKLLVDKGLHKRIIWNVRSRVDTIDREMLEALKAAGCYRIFYGIESGNPQVLEKLNKMTDIKRIEEIVRLTDRFGISTFGYFLVGSPGDTHATIRQTIDFAKRLPLDFAIFNALTPFPQTPLYQEYYLPLAHDDFWADYIRRDTPPEHFVGRPWLDIDNEEIKRIGHAAMLEFFFRPGQALRALRTVRSWDQFKRYSLAAIDMGTSYLKNLATRRD